VGKNTLKVTVAQASWRQELLFGQFEGFTHRAPTFRFGSIS
jgi:hypothetical protein